MIYIVKKIKPGHHTKVTLQGAKVRKLTGIAEFVLQPANSYLRKLPIIMARNSPTDSLNDHALVARLQQGDYTAFDQLYVRYAEEIAWRLKRLVKLDEITEELHQEVFLRLWEQRQKMNHQAPLRPFLLRMAYNVAIDFFRKASRDRSLKEQLILHASELYEATPEDFIINNSDSEVKEWVRRIIDRLPPQRKQIFIYCKMEGRSYEDAAREFGVSINTIKDHMTRAMRFLKSEALQNSPFLVTSMLSTIIFF